MLSRTGSRHKSAESVLGEEKGGGLQLEELVEKGRFERGVKKRWSYR